MKILVHHNDCQPFRIVSSDGKEYRASKNKSADILWELAERFPDEVIGWCEKSLSNELNLKIWPEVFQHDLVMASYAVNNSFLPDALGYIDQWPFVNINRKVQYGTWQMSSDVGGIKGETLLKFRQLLSGIKNFEFLINSIGKLGQQNGLFCYSSPKLVKSAPDPVPTASTEQLFGFVYSHYKTFRFFLLLWCFYKQENSVPVWNFIKAFFQKKYFGARVDLKSLSLKSNVSNNIIDTIDVIIPTMGRRKYLLQVMEDLRQQTFLPKKVIVVEQNPDPGSRSDLPELLSETWPFEVVHHFIHQTGACNARNMALEETNACWVFFADDDNRIGSDLLKNAIGELKKYSLDSVTMNYRQQGEVLIYHEVKQWGTFGAGNSIVSGEFTSSVRFDPAFEFGYAEDKDYGMQLRNAGCDIVYHPGLEIEHLKAPMGGFRKTEIRPWEEDRPKPSPTLMMYALKHYTKQQLTGFKYELFLRYYFRQEIRSPWKYLRMMNKRWRKSEEWAIDIKSGEQAGLKKQVHKFN